MSSSDLFNLPGCALTTRSYGMWPNNSVIQNVEFIGLPETLLPLFLLLFFLLLRFHIPCIVLSKTQSLKTQKSQGCLIPCCLGLSKNVRNHVPVNFRQVFGHKFSHVLKLTTMFSSSFESSMWVLGLACFSLPLERFEHESECYGGLPESFLALCN